MTNLIPDKIIDWHVHSEYSYCSVSTSINKLKLKKLKSIPKLENFCISDHLLHICFKEQYQLKSLASMSLKERYKTENNILNEIKYNKDNIYRYIERVKKEGLLAGCEIDFSLSGEFLFDWNLLNEFDCILGSIHTLETLQLNKSNEEIEEDFLSQNLKALDFPIDILTHPCFVFRNKEIKIKNDTFQKIFNKATNNHIAIEINLRSKDLDFNNYANNITENTLLSIGSDAHEMHEFGNYSYAELLIYRLKNEIGNFKILDNNNLRINN